jgi:ankyrin repeat protein
MTMKQSLKFKLPIVIPSFDVIEFLIEMDPKMVQETIESNIPLLHWACSTNAPLDVIKDILSVYPDAIKICDERLGYLPLHFACYYKASIEIIEFLIQIYPESIQKIDKEGKVPLHISCATTRTLRESYNIEYSNLNDIIHLLYSSYKDGAFVSDIFGMVPAQYISDENISLLEILPMH